MAETSWFSLIQDAPRNAYQYMKNIEKTGNDPRDLDMLLVPHGTWRSLWFSV